MRAPLTDRPRGFTLLEVMVALAVLAVAFTALLGLQVRNLRLVAREQAYSRALLLAQTLVTNAELEGYPPVGESRGDFEEPYPGDYPGFTWERTVSDSWIPNLREVTVRVLPPGEPGATAELTVWLRTGAT